MNNLSFETLTNGWNAIRMSGAPNMRQVVPGLIDPARIVLQRVGETPETMTIMFKGFEQALERPEEDAPLMKHQIMAWIKEFAEVQIERSGDPMSFIIRIIKPQQTPAQMAVESKWDTIMEALTVVPTKKIKTAPLANITNVRIKNGR
jgi:hypothetical protein